MQNEIHYGSIPLSVVARISSSLYKTKSFIDAETNLVLIERSGKGMIPFKPQTNPRQMIELVAYVLDRPRFSLTKNRKGQFVFTSETSIEREHYVGNNIWEAAAFLILDLLAKGEV